MAIDRDQSRTRRGVPCADGSRGVVRPQDRGQVGAGESRQQRHLDHLCELVGVVDEPIRDEGLEPVREGVGARRKARVGQLEESQQGDVGEIRRINAGAAFGPVKIDVVIKQKIRMQREPQRPAFGGAVDGEIERGRTLNYPVRDALNFASVLFGVAFGL